MSRPRGRRAAGLVLPSKSSRQISKREKDQAENGAQEIEVVPGGVGRAPPHEGEQVERFKDVSEHDHYEAGRTGQLQDRRDGSFSNRRGKRPSKKDRDGRRDLYSVLPSPISPLFAISRRPAIPPMTPSPIVSTAVDGTTISEDFSLSPS